MNSSAAAGSGGEVLFEARRRGRSELFERAACGAGALMGVGLGPGDALAILMRNGFEFLEAWVAASLIGARAVPLNYHARPGELSRMLAACGARAVVAHTDLVGGVDLGGAALFTAGPEEIAGAVSWDAAIAAADPIPRQENPGGGSIVFTGGSTGLPKPVLRLPRTAEQTASYLETTNPVYGLSPGMRTLVSTPMYHSAPLYHATAALLLGGTIVIRPRFEPADFLASIEANRITNLLMVPTQFVRLLKLDAQQRGGHDLSSLEHVVHGAAPCAPSVKRAMIEWLGPILYEYYGCTESGIVAACTSAEWLARPGTVGRPLKGAVVRIYDAQGQVSAGAAGEIFVRHQGAADFTYPGNPKDRAGVERDGLVTCGDIGMLDEAGYLYLLDRKKDMAIIGGVNVFPAEVESELLRLPGVLDAAVFAVPDEEYGEVLRAAVVLEAGETAGPAAMLATLRSRLAAIKVPQAVDVLEALPRDESGKIAKRVLRDPFWAGREREI